MSQPSLADLAPLYAPHAAYLALELADCLHEWRHGLLDAPATGRPS
jgi:hypothetical protein